MSRSSRDWEEVRARLHSLEDIHREDHSLSRLFEERAERLAQRPRAGATPGVAPEQEYLLFQVDSKSYGVPLESVRGAHPLVHLSPVPGSHPAIVGVTSLRGKILAVVDLATVLSGSGAPLRLHFLCIVWKGVEFGLAADTVLGIQGHASEDLLAVEGGSAGETITGLLRLDGGRTAELLSLEALLRALGVDRAS